MILLPPSSLRGALSSKETQLLSFWQGSCEHSEAGPVKSLYTAPKKWVHPSAERGQEAHLKMISHREISVATLLLDTEDLDGD